MGDAVDAVVEGAFVELHSLSSADMNGRVGFCGPFNSGTGRFPVQLCQDGTSSLVAPIAIKAENLRRAPAPDTATRDAATAKIKEAGAAMERARSGELFLAPGQDPTTQENADTAELLRSAEALLSEAAQSDPANQFLHVARMDICAQRMDKAGVIRHAHRVIANPTSGERGLTTHARMSLANALMQQVGTAMADRDPGARSDPLAYANETDMEGATAQLRMVLRDNPEDLYARYLLGGALIGCGRAGDAIPELMMATQLPPGSERPEQAAGIQRAAAGLLAEARARVAAGV